MRYLYVLILVFCIVPCLFAQKVEVLKKTSEPYSGNISQACERKMKHGKLEVVNHLKYFEVKRNSKVLAQFDPINIDRNSLYIWAELSPNSKMLLFNASDQGVFVCDLKGEVKYNLGRNVHAVSWWDNRYIVGMIDEDNGVEFIKSGKRKSLPAYHVQGRRHHGAGNLRQALCAVSQCPPQRAADCLPPEPGRILHHRAGQRARGYRGDGCRPGQRYRGSERAGQREDRRFPGKAGRPDPQDHRGQEQAGQPDR